jgi:hypothetical protein
LSEPPQQPHQIRHHSDAEATINWLIAPVLELPHDQRAELLAHVRALAELPEDQRGHVLAIAKALVMRTVADDTTPRGASVHLLGGVSPKPPQAGR